jgi:hypothetical protein
MINIDSFFKALRPHLNEKLRRIVAAALTVGGERGVKATVVKETGVSFREIRRGLTELNDDSEKTKGIRLEGGGRKKVTEKDPGLTEVLLSLVDSTTRGDPEHDLKWTCKSLRILAVELQKRGHNVSYKTIGSILEANGYSLQGNRKVKEGDSHPDRNAQFEYINKKVKLFKRINQPIISVDCKKHELVGNYKNNGREYHPKSQAPEVKDHDFIDKELGKAIPYGVYDILHNKGYVNVGIDHDTSVFAIQSIRNWWFSMGINSFYNAKRLLITADCGGSNGYRRKLWRVELTKFAEEAGLKISVCHLPVGTSKWNKIEHRLFSMITMNWRGRPLTSLGVIVNLIGSTKSTTGLTVKCELDEDKYPNGQTVSKEELANLNIKRDKFHGEWNYTIMPRENIKQIIQ